MTDRICGDIVHTRCPDCNRLLYYDVGEIHDENSACYTCLVKRLKAKYGFFWFWINLWKYWFATPPKAEDK